MFSVVLVEPEIPPNTGNVGRLCLATQSTLHLVRPLGFLLDDRQLRRAGLDYWDEVPLQIWDSFDALQGAQSVETRYFFLTTNAQYPYYSVDFRKNDFFVFVIDPNPVLFSVLAFLFLAAVLRPFRITFH